MESRVSNYNFMMQNNSLPDDFIFCDVTLRDGEQTPGVSFSSENKKQIARKLDNMGIDQIQIGIVGNADNDELAELCNLGLKSDVEIMTRGTHKEWKENIKTAMDLGSDIVHTFIPTSPYIRGMYTDYDDTELLKHAEKIINYMKSINGNKKINVSLLDATRSNQDFLLKMVDLLSSSGVDRIRLADTVGTASPDGIYYLVSEVKEQAIKNNKETIIGIHCHNDFGLAVANAFAASKAGASLIDVSVNGLGDRSGNPALAEVLTGLHVLYGKEIKFDFKELKNLSLLVEKFSGVQIPKNKPLIGNYAFADEFDGHITALLKDPFAFQGIEPESVGNKREIVVGKNSGPTSLRYKFKELGIDLTDQECERLLKEIKILSEKNKGVIFSDDQLLHLYNEVTS